MTAFADFRRGPLPNTERIGDCVLCLPLYNELRDELLDMIAGVVVEHTKSACRQALQFSAAS
jgi:dTDP-4-amino-4,6-dideoxygalactose transaminase